MKGFKKQLKGALVSELIGMVQLSENHISIHKLYQAVDRAFAEVDILHVRSFDHAIDKLCTDISELCGNNMTLEVKRCAFNSYSKWHAARRRQPQSRGGKQGVLSRVVNRLTNAAGIV